MIKKIFGKNVIILAIVVSFCGCTTINTNLEIWAKNIINNPKILDSYTDTTLVTAHFLTSSSLYNCCGTFEGIEQFGKYKIFYFGKVYKSKPIEEKKNEYAITFINEKGLYLCFHFHYIKNRWKIHDITIYSL